ncbi:MAG TPA: hypothetical protein VJ933_00215 [Phaeodactylibacter sp.]|nr:hypothetical protein [Phaeodactylibacter sp.]
MNTQFITDADGNKLAVVIPIKEYQVMLEAIEELEDIRLYDASKAEDDGGRITLEDYVANRKLEDG